MTNYTLDPAAAELEGLAPMPEDLVPLRTEKQMLDEQIAQLTTRLDQIKAEFGKRLEDEGLNGFILNGKVHARKSNGTRTSVDSKRLKDEMPHVYANFMKVTNYTSIKIS